MRFCPTSLATEDDLREMIGWFGDFLDRWCHKFTSQNLSTRPDQWVFIVAYNLLEVIEAVAVRPTSTEAALCVRNELIGGLGQVVLGLFVLGSTLGIKPSELILRGGRDFLRFQEERYGTSWVHKLRQWCLKRVKQGVDTKGTYQKILCPVAKLGVDKHEKISQSGRTQR